MSLAADWRQTEPWAAPPLQQSSGAALCVHTHIMFFLLQVKGPGGLVTQAKDMAPLVDQMVGCYTISYTMVWFQNVLFKWSWEDSTVDVFCFIFP